MSRRVSVVLFYLIALWCVSIGTFNQTISGVDDLPWVARALEGTDVSKFNPILAVWARWIGMFLITAGVSLGLLIRTAHESKTKLAATSVLSIGTVGAQCISVLSLGAFGPPVFLLPTIVFCAVIAAISGFMSLSTEDT